MAGSSTIRKANLSDIARIVELSERKRLEYQTYQPRFWRKAADSSEKQTPYLERLLANERVRAFVHEREGAVDGFVIGSLVGAPPVYDPGGLTCLIDDFVAEDWATVGADLLAEVSRWAKLRGAVQTVVVCGHQDQPKRSMLAGGGYSIASEWYVREIV